MLTAAKLDAVQVAQARLDDLLSQARGINGLLSAHEVPIEGLYIGAVVAAYNLALHRLVDEHEKEAHAAAARATA